jgi:hypothetical protein
MFRNALILTALLLAGNAATANAADVTYDWTFTSAPGVTDNNGTTFTAQGQLTIDTSVTSTATVSPSPTGTAYVIQSISGTDSYGTITGLIGPGNSSYIYDNLLYPSGTAGQTATPAYIDWGGILYNSQSVVGNTIVNQAVNLFSSVAGGTSFDRYATASAYDNNHAGTFAISAVPLPGGLTLFASGFAAIGAIAWKRKRSKAV